MQNKQDSIARMQQLAKQLNIYAHEYYVLDNSTISDKQYDVLYDELVALEKQTGTVLEISPTRRVGGDALQSFSQHTHIQRLYSLDKAQNFDDLENFFKNKNGEEFTLEYKFDGITICLTYENGKFLRATTRGNGYVGEDVTNNVLTIKTFPMEISYKGRIEVIGEAIINLSTLEKYNQTASVKLKNARNASAGAIRNLDPKETAKRSPKIVFYNINFQDSEEIISQSQAVEFLKSEGFLVSEYFKITKSVEEIKSQLEQIELSRGNLDFLIDGAVIKINDYQKREQLGSTEKFPRWAIAYKFEAEEAKTVLNKVVWQVGRTGKLTPLALLEPVDLCGVTVSRATLNNMQDIAKKGVKIGDTVLVRRSNDVIPEILGTYQKGENAVEIEMPKSCPSCGKEITEIGAHIFCKNPHCSGMVIQKLSHFASKNAFDIEGFSEKTAKLLYENFGIESEYQLFDLQKDQLLSLPSFKEKKAENLMKSLEKSRKIDYPQFIFSLGIPNIGTKTAKDLAREYPHMNLLKEAKFENLCEIGDIGEIVASSVVDFFKTKTEKLEKLLERVEIQYKTAVAEGIFSGEKMVLTGSLPTLSRSVASKIIENQGGEMLSTVSKKTTLVVCGEDAGSKLEKAQKLGLRIIFGEEFEEMIKEYK
ncbi:MAG: NAD-dependent DNA ligase LigA [Bacillota bacterium]